MNDKFAYDPVLYDELVRQQHAQFPSIVLPPEYAELFETNTLQVLIKLARYKFVARMLKKTDDVLEVGSGTGLGAIFLSQHVKRVTVLRSNHTTSMRLARSIGGRMSSFICGRCSTT